MVKGWREGEGNGMGGGEVNDMGERGSQSFACADVVWVVVLGIVIPPIVGRGWEGMASSAGLGAQGTF